MRKNILSLSIGIVAFCAGIVFFDTARAALLYAPDTEMTIPPTEIEVREVSEGDHPIRLRIPHLEIDAHVQEVGTNALGNMAAPNNFTDVGWYRYGTPPGFLGSAVMTGHVDNALALAGVFKHLKELQIDDDVYVTKKEGGELHFKVTEIQTYPYDMVPLDTLFSRHDVPRLNLVTCSGMWLSHERSYDERLIIYTELVDI